MTDDAQLAGFPPEGAVVVVATRNPGKVRELGRLMVGAGWTLAGLEELQGGVATTWEEDGDTYQENAAIKARAACLATSLPALADDSGLELLALDRWPGLRSARWLGEDATEDQLRDGIAERVATLPETDRGAEFVCALALAWPLPGRPPGLVTVIARAPGKLLATPRGELGFGYDPIFVPSGEQRTTAEMSSAEKDALSHRGQAARLMAARVAEVRAKSEGS